jgi:antirestriction protein ArdC
MHPARHHAGSTGDVPRWKSLGRFVRRGEKAITLCQPVTVKRKGEPSDATTDDEPEAFTRFVYRPHWFVIAQTDGQQLPPMPIPSWDRTRALAALDITEEPFTHMNGNVMGYAIGRTIAVSPIAAFPFKTTAHEIAHVLLHCGENEQADSDTKPRNLREVEAEAVAMLFCAALGLPGIPEARGYVQHWLGMGNDIPEPSARRILKAADQILKACSASTSEGTAA